MYYSDLVLPTPAENLALEESWLELAENGQWSHEILRLWEPTSDFVVIGRGSRVATEVNIAATQVTQTPVLRRSSGGAAIVAGQGCLMYAVLLSYEKRPHVRSIDAAHREVMETLLRAIAPLLSGVQWQGTCDLVVLDDQHRARKVSGNSLRCRRNWMLYHGTLLLAMDLGKIERFLLHPPREPEYRQNRSHADFVANLGLPAQPLIASLISAWGADSQSQVPQPEQLIQQLVTERYANSDWTFQR